MKLTWWCVVGAGGCGGDRLVTHIYTAVDCTSLDVKFPFIF